GSWSWLKSPTSTVVGDAPTAVDVAGPKVPSPSPRSTETLPAPKLAETKSSTPSPSPSRVAPARACAPTAYCAAGPYRGALARADPGTITKKPAITPATI